MRKGLQGSWPQALGTFLLPILIILGIRWALIEPFVIPSGSMIPNLLVHDHIVVLKTSMGLKLPFSDQWLAFWSPPHRGDIVVFKFPENPNIYYIKRLIGLPGDKVSVEDGHITVNGDLWLTTDTTHIVGDEPGFEYLLESSGSESHRIRFYDNERDLLAPKTFDVPADHYFFMGDNRDQSSDGRAWGFVPKKYLVGRAWMIWLSCENTLASASYICDFSTLRPGRIFKIVK